MPKAKAKMPRRKKVAPVAPKKADEGYRYRDSDALSISVTVLAYGAEQGNAAKVLVNGVSPY